MHLNKITSAVVTVTIIRLSGHVDKFKYAGPNVCLTWRSQV